MLINTRRTRKRTAFTRTYTNEKHAVQGTYVNTLGRNRVRKSISGTRTGTLRWSMVTLVLVLSLLRTSLPFSSAGRRSRFSSEAILELSKLLCGPAHICTRFLGESPKMLRCENRTRLYSTLHSSCIIHEI